MKIKSLLEKLDKFEKKFNEAVEEITWKQVIKQVDMSDMEADMLAKDLGHSSFAEMEQKSPPKEMYKGDPMAFANAFKNRVRELSFIPNREVFQKIENILNIPPDESIDTSDIDSSNEGFKDIFKKIRK